VTQKGAFTPLGLTLVHSLAARGAHVIALTPDPVEAPQVATLVELLRTSTNNEHIFAEHCAVSSPASVRAFCTRFVTGNETRVDALVFAHEYATRGTLALPWTTWFASGVRGEHGRRELESEREAASMGTFLMLTLLLPVLLTAPPERDIRILTVVNPFYAAAVPSFAASLSAAPFSAAAALSSSTKSTTATLPPPTPTKQIPTLLAEGTRALRTAILTRHLQRVLDALPNRAPAPPTSSSDGSSSQPTTVPPLSAQPSNIVAVSVSPGVSRADTVRILLGEGGAGLIVYVLL
jgi:NAD(P)-dependent dehydrogenase (short-subunit alcohol dehydrogenase family)